MTRADDERQDDLLDSLRAGAEADAGEIRDVAENVPVVKSGLMSRLAAAMRKPWVIRVAIAILVIVTLCVVASKFGGQGSELQTSVAKTAAVASAAVQSAKAANTAVATPAEQRTPKVVDLSGCDPLSLKVVPGTDGRKFTAPDHCVRYEY